MHEALVYQASGAIFISNWGQIPIKSWLVACLLLAGSRPGRRGTFLCFAKEKYPKERRPHCLRPLRFAQGQPVVLAGGVRCGTRCALARSAQTAAASQSTKRVCPAAHAPPRPLRSSAHTEGMGNGHPHGPSLRSAPFHGRKRLALRRLGRAQRRPVWLFGCSRLSTPCGCACGGAVAGWHGRRSAHASSSDSPWLSERRCAAAKRVPRRTPQPPRRRFAP